MNNQISTNPEPIRDPDQDIYGVVGSKKQQARREARREAHRRAILKRQLKYIGWAFLAGMLFERILTNLF